MESFDLAVLGGGPGGYPLALRMARHGWKIALIERPQELGGTCLNWGCIPTKALLASAKGLHFLRNCKQWGLSAEAVGFQWDQVLQRKDSVVKRLRQGIETLLKQAGVTTITGTGTLLPGKILRIASPSGDQPPCEIRAERICLAVGSVPSVPGFFPGDRRLVWSSDEALTAQTLPESLLIIGGGVIGLEMGQVFAEFGAKVTVVELLPNILNGLDASVSKRLIPVFKKAGLEILTGHKVEQLTCRTDSVTAVISGQERTFARVLVAVGRHTNLSCLEGSPVVLERHGTFLKINERFETSEPGVYAIGDAVPGPMLAHKASYDAAVLAAQWRGDSVSPSYEIMPSCVYTYPEIAWVGLSEEEATARGLSFKVGRSMFSANGKALAAGEGDGQVKTLVGNNGKLLGAVIWGPEASNLISEAAVMAGLKFSAHDLVSVIHPHPTLSEAFLEGVESAAGGGVHG
jgi:dihydrolipoamide dehydrogenase